MRIESITLHEIGPFDDVKIDFPEGTDPDLADVYLLIGPNGCGKTTALYAIAALLDDDPSLLRPRMRSEDSRASIVVSGQGRASTRAMGFFFPGTASDGRPLPPLDDYSHNARLKGNLVGAKRLSWAAFAYAGTRRLQRGQVGAISEPASNPLGESLWVRLFSGTLDGSNSDHLTSFKCGRKGGSGFGTARSA